MITRTCAICNDGEKRMLFSQPLAMPEGIRSYSGYNIVVCAGCGFVFADDTISQEESDEHYGGQTKVAQVLSVRGEPEPDLLRLDNTASLIQRFLQPGNRVLDVGCGTARLLSVLKENGFDGVQGIDQSPTAAEIARVKYGIPVTLGSIFGYAKERFDFVIVCHVLEHVIDLSTFLPRIYNMLNSGGMVYVEVPDTVQFERFADPAGPEPWPYVRDLLTHFTPEHVNFFTAVSLTNLMRRFGFQEVYCQPNALGVVASVWGRAEPRIDLQGEAAIRGYAAASHGLQENALKIIRRVAESGQQVVIWGAGLHTQRLLGSGQLSRCNIIAFADSDPTYKGSHLMGKPIIHPEKIASLPGRPSILVSSWKAQVPIAAAIKSMNLANDVILLY